MTVNINVDFRALAAWLFSLCFWVIQTVGAACMHMHTLKNNALIQGVLIMPLFKGSCEVAAGEWHH